MFSELTNYKMLSNRTEFSLTIIKLIFLWNNSRFDGWQPPERLEIWRISSNSQHFNNTRFFQRFGCCNTWAIDINTFASNIRQNYHPTLLSFGLHLFIFLVNFQFKSGELKTSVWNLYLYFYFRIDFILHELIQC